ncbi:hypothetical protein GIY23_06335 [Allosaccharopolyspora coralli]|uniref:Uncharacterized protein n=1 Tax=Allosaccharopolyspora coralli TaxID=2665642 RepID=A0A5Q3Q5U0_9PSEU|nr:hypothetical protein [Allosaccharopolyspora coralli]QGK69200.1 hypothetical protein GIY23_06335 [Allosaccharopolyspora coralli]
MSTWPRPVMWALPVALVYATYFNYGYMLGDVSYGGTANGTLVLESCQADWSVFATRSTCVGEVVPDEGEPESFRHEFARFTVDDVGMPIRVTDDRTQSGRGWHTVDEFVPSPLFRVLLLVLPIAALLTFLRALATVRPRE